MISRMQVVTKLRGLQNFTFIAYIEQQAPDVHDIQLQFIAVNPNTQVRESITTVFRVSEYPGYLKAFSLDRRYSFSKLQ